MNRIRRFMLLLVVWSAFSRSDGVGVLSDRFASAQSTPAAADGGADAAIGRLPKGYEKVVAVTLEKAVYRTDVSGSLIRELGRQGLMIAAEHELGLTTLDLCIGEPIPVGDALPGPFSVRVVGVKKLPPKATNPFISAPHDFTITISRPELNGQPRVWTSPQMTFQDNDWYEPLVEQIESLSRGALVDFLQKAGFEKGPRATGTKSTGKLENRLDFISQFALIKSLHAELQASGETPELLEELARAYANLGSLTDFHWSPASKGFKARALLYAQRLVAKHGPSPSSLAHRAYARALVGRHGAALADIQAARTAEGKKAPDWLNLLQDYCEYQPGKLELVKGPHAELAQYLRVNMLNLTNERTRSVELIQKFLKTNPACCRMADLLASVPALGAQRTATELTFNETWPQVYQRLSTVPNLPASAKKIAEAAKGRKTDPRSEYAKRRELIGQLQAGAGVKDQAGPSWQVLADMIRDASMAQAWRILDVESNSLGMKADQSLDRLNPLIYSHPFEKFLNSYTSDRQAGNEILSHFATTVDKNLLEASAIPLALELYQKVDSREGDDVVFKLRTNVDRIYEDAIRDLAIPFYGPDNRQMVLISPHWPVSIAEEIKRNPKAPLAEWEQKYESSAVVMLELYRKHRAEKRTLDATRCLKKAIEIAPTCPFYMELAALYEDEGDRAAWKEALDQALKLPSAGLEHAEIHAMQADSLMRQGKWKEAKPHAAKAADSYSAFGLGAAARVAEGMENWAEAEKYRQQMSQRYDTCATDWYFWCLRTGRGKLKDAKALAMQHWSSLPGQLNGDELFRAVAGHLVDGNRNDAIKLLRGMFKQERRVVAGVYAAVLADEDGSADIRDQLFRDVAATTSSSDPFVEMSGGFRGVLSGRESARWNPRAFEVQAVGCAEDKIPFLYLTAGQFLGNHGEKELSKEYLQCAATAFHVDSVASVIAADLLRKKKLTVGKVRPNVLPDGIAPLSEQLAKALRDQRNGRLQDAGATLAELLKLRPDFLPALLARIGVDEDQGKYAEAIADCEDVIRKYPDSYTGYNRLSRLLATCDKDEIRNGPKALENAERAAGLREFETNTSLTTLSMAHAECGQFDKAIDFEKRAAKLPGFDPTYNERMSSYFARKPYRMKPRSDVSIAATSTANPAAPATKSVESATKPAPSTQAAASPFQWKDQPLVVDPVGEPIDLMKQVNMKRDAARGTWQQTKGTFVGDRHSQIFLPAKLPEDYQLKFAIRRVEGNDTLAIGFMLGGRQGTVVFDWDRTPVCGLYLDGREPSDNATTRRVAAFQGAATATIVLTVHPRRFHATFDGRTLIDCEGDAGRMYHHSAHWQVGSRECPSVSTADARYAVESAWLIPIKPQSAPQRPARLDSEIAILPMINLDRDVHQGKWEFDQNTLTSPSGWGKIYVPTIVPEEYTLSATVELPAGHRGDHGFGIGLIAGSSYFQFQTTATVTGLDAVDGHRFFENETRLLCPLLKPGVPSRIECTVTKTGVRAEVDGKTVVDWRGDFRRLSVPGDWALPNGNRLFLAGMHRFLFRDIKLGPPLPAPKLPEQPRLSAGEPLDVLKHIVPARDSYGGTWELDGTSLRCRGNFETNMLAIPLDVPDEYRVTMRVARTDGGKQNDECLLLQFPFADSKATLAVDTFASTMCGIYLDDIDLKEGVCVYRGGFSIPKNGTACDIDLTVERTRVRLSIGGKSILDWTGNPGRGSTTVPLATPGRRLTLGSWNQGLRFERVQLEPLPTTNPPEIPMLGDDGNLLASIQTTRDGRRGEWKLSDEGLSTPKAANARLSIPVSPPQTYILSASVERLQQGGRDLILGLVVGGHSCAVSIDGGNGSEAGLDRLDDKRFLDAANFTHRAYGSPIFTTGKTVKVRCYVMPDTVVVACDNKEVVRWHGDSRRLWPEPSYLPVNYSASEREQLWLGSSRTSFLIRELKLQPMTEKMAAELRASFAGVFPTTRQDGVPLRSVPPLLDGSK